jgi:hypothetical protein
LIERHVRKLDGSPRSAIAALGIASLAPGQAGPERIAVHVRGHWGIENKLHYVRDLAYGEDKSRVRTGNAPQVMASLRNLTIAAVAASAGPASHPGSAGHPATTPARCHCAISQGKNARPLGRNRSH